MRLLDYEINYKIEKGIDEAIRFQFLVISFHHRTIGNNDVLTTTEQILHILRYI